MSLNRTRILSSENDSSYHQERNTNINKIINRFLQILLSIYEAKTIKVNDLLICHSATLIELMKPLTKADKVELIVNGESGCTGCISNTKYLINDSILVYINKESFDLKYQFNNGYTEFIRHNISLKTSI